MYKFYKIFLFIILTTSNLLLGINPEENKPRYRVSGTVMDAQTDKPLQYATIALLSLPDSAIANGIITDGQGSFTVRAEQQGDYLLRIMFIGYESFYTHVTLSPDNPAVSVGVISLEHASVDIDEVSIEAENRSIEYKIDRKVINVSENYTAMSGTAVDILRNVPSIDVDIENNVSIRGNSNFTVLIDGRPSVLEASEALQQFTAGMIREIEIITNPSAKYDPEGTGGIINIITEKRTILGLSGLVHADVGLDDKYGADFLLNYRTEKFNYYVGADYSNRTYPGTVERRQETFSGDTISYLNTEGDYQRGYNSYSGRAGIEWFPNKKNVVNISGRYGYRASLSSSMVNYEEWTNYSPGINRYTNMEESKRDGGYYSFNGEYTHYFNGDNRDDGREHRLDVNLMYYMREGDEYSLNYLMDEEGERSDGQQSTEAGPSAGLEYRINYEQSFIPAFNIEAGAQGRYGDSNESNALYFYDAATDVFNLQPEFSNDVTYRRNIHAAYGLMKGEVGNLGYQLGIRGEYTYRDILLQDQGAFNIDRWDYFPTLHVSYSLNEQNQFMASYSRRIDRPRGWFLEPFITWSDAFNVRRGNPGLLPEYIDSYEIGYQRELNETDFLSAEVYYRVTENKIERVRGVYRENIMLSTFANIGTDYALGSEIMLSMRHFDWWESDYSGNFYNYRVEGEVLGETLDRGQFTWSVETNHIFRISNRTRLQFSAEYDSREIEAQETESPTFEFDAAVRQSFLDNKILLTLQLRDIFGTDQHESVIEASDFYAYRLYRHRSPIVMLNLTFRINNFRTDNGESMGGGEDGYGGGGEM